MGAPYKSRAIFTTSIARTTPAQNPRGVNRIIFLSISLCIGSLHYNNTLDGHARLQPSNVPLHLKLMPRLAGIEPSQANLFTRIVYWMTKRQIGRVIEP